MACGLLTISRSGIMKPISNLQYAICIFRFALFFFFRSIAPLALTLSILSTHLLLAQSRPGRSIDSELLKNLKTQSKKDIERDVFAPADKKEKDKFQTGAGQGDANLNEQLQRELGAAAEKEDDNPMLTIARNMSQVKDRISQTDAGPATINMQKQIVADLDLLINQARKQCSSSSASCPNPSAQGQKPSSKSGKNPAKKPGTKPANVDAPQTPAAQTRKPDMDEMRSMMKNLWGELPPHVREQILQSPSEEFVPKYELQIEDYFRDLSNEKINNE